MREANLNEEVKKRHILKTMDVIDPDKIDWKCPFCAPPALTLKLPPKDKLSEREQIRTTIATHLQQHRQDLLAGLKTATNGKTKVTEERTRATILWIDSSINDYAMLYE